MLFLWDSVSDRPAGIVSGKQSNNPTYPIQFPAVQRKRPYRPELCSGIPSNGGKNTGTSNVSCLPLVWLYGHCEALHDIDGTPAGTVATLAR